MKRQEAKMNIELAENQLTESAASPKTFSVKKIVAALDLSPHSEATAQYALGIAKTLGASLVLVHVYEPIQMNEFITEEGFRVQEHDRQVMQQAVDRPDQDAPRDLSGVYREIYRWRTTSGTRVDGP